MRHPYPIVLDVDGLHAVVVGGGHVAARKVAGLLRAGARVTVISPQIGADIDPDAVDWQRKRYASGDIPADAALVFACTDDADVNRQIAEDARADAPAGALRLVNDTANPAHSNFTNAAVAESGGVTVAVSTNGHAPATARRVKERLAALLPTLLGTTR